MLQLEETILGRYRVQTRLSRGGMSEVYLARDEQANQNVAIKLVNSYYADHLARLQREAEALHQLQHTHILPTLEYGEHEPWHYLVMPYMEHGTLRQRLTKGRLSLEEAGRILEQIAGALQYAHDRGILHRDIKPSNILFANERHVYLADFGLAKTIGDGNHITQTGCLIGTPEYMAPELAEQEATTSSDIYALGIVLYQMLTGQVPFRGGTPLSVYWKQIRDQPLPPSLLNPAIPPDVEQVILRALEKDPGKRFATPLELAQAYTQALRAAEQTVEAELIAPLAQTTSQVQVTYYKVNTTNVGAGLMTSQVCSPRNKARSGISSSPTFSLPALLSWWQRPRHMMQTSVAALFVLVFLLITPLSLGFMVSKSTQAPLVNVGTQSIAPSKLEQGLGHSPAPVQNASSANKAQNISEWQEFSQPTPPVHREEQGNQSEGQADQNEQEHKHGHGHKHGHDDDPPIKEVPQVDIAV